MNGQKVNENDLLFTNIEKLNSLSDIVSYNHILDQEVYNKNIGKPIVQQMADKEFRRYIVAVCYCIRRGCVKYSVSDPARRRIFRYVYRSTISRDRTSISDYVEYYNKVCIEKFKNRPYNRETDKVYGRPDISKELMAMVDKTPILKFLFSAPLQLDPELASSDFFICNPSQRNFKNEKVKETKQILDDFNKKNKAMMQEILDELDDLVNDLRILELADSESKDKKLEDSGDVEENPGPRYFDFKPSVIRVEVVVPSVKGCFSTFARYDIIPSCSLLSGRDNFKFLTKFEDSLQSNSKLYLTCLSQLSDCVVPLFVNGRFDYYYVVKTVVSVVLETVVLPVRIRVFRVDKSLGSENLTPLGEMVLMSPSRVEFFVGALSPVLASVSGSYSVLDTYFAVGIESLGHVDFKIEIKQNFCLRKGSLLTQDPNPTKGGS